MTSFNKNFFKFVYGFLGMISVGLLGVVIVGYFTPENKTPDDSPDKSTEINTVDNLEAKS